MTDVNLHYSGGSGGFLVLHLLLLSKKFFCKFEGLRFINDQNFDYHLKTILEIQWNIKEPSTWKHSEFWPNNPLTEFVTTNRSKLFFHCNTFVKSPEEKSILVYTDIKSQNLLCQLKQARNYRLLDVEENFNWISIYYDIKADTWSNDVTLSTKFESLPEYQQVEILNKMSKLNTHTKNPIINGVEVLEEVAEFYKHADYAFKLQDVVNSRGKIVTDTLNLVYLESQEELVNRWMALHPKDFLDKIGIY